MGRHTQKLAKLQVKIEKQLKEKINRIQEKVALVAITHTVVDTGLAAANWTPSVGVRDQGYLPHEFFGIQSQFLSYPNERLISETAALKVATDIPNYRLGETLYITNSVPYRPTAIDETVITASRSQMIDLGQAEANK